MKDLIRSKDVREYVEKIGYEFSDFEKTVLILNGGQPLTKVHQELSELAANTLDLKLKKNILVKLSYDQECLKALRTPAADELYMIKMLHEDRGDDENREYFTSYEDALDYASGSGREFYISKIKLHMGKTKWYEREFGDGIIGYIRHVKGEAVSYCSNVFESPQYEFDDPDEDDFEYVEIPIPHQFKTGDMIRNISTGDCGIVVLNYEDDACEIEGVGKVYKSESITVELVDDDGLFYHAHITPDCLEFANLTAEDPLKDLLECAGYLVRGTGFIQSFQMEYEKYVERMKKRK